MQDMSITSQIVAFGLVLVLAACGGGGVEGTYRDELGVSEYRFDGGGTVEIAAMGIIVDGEYEEKKDQVIVHGPHGTLVFRKEGARLVGPMGLALRRIDDTEKGDER